MRAGNNSAAIAMIRTGTWTMPQGVPGLEAENVPTGESRWNRLRARVGFL
jgi:hypothetical protein